MTEIKICKKTGRPFPEGIQADGERFEYLRNQFEKMAPENAPGTDLPPIKLRTVSWVQNHLCEGLIENQGQWIKLAEDQTWWSSVTILMQSNGTWDSLQKRMAGLIKTQILKIELSMEAKGRI